MKHGRVDSNGRVTRSRVPRHERGAALVAVLAMVLLLSGLAAFGLSRLKAATDRVSDTEAQAQANRLAEAGVGAAMPMANRLKARGTRRAELFAEPVRIDLAGGQVVLRFRDGGGCFNLNSLGKRDGADRSDTSVRDFARLLVAAGVERMQADQLAAATAQRLGSSGILWADASEWVRVPGVTAAIWQRMEPLLCALPTREPATFNVNALTPAQAPLLVTIGLSEQEAQRVLAARPADGWQSANDFWGVASQRAPSGNAAAAATGTSSRWIEVSVMAATAGATAGRVVLLDTARAPARVAAARWTSPPDRNAVAALMTMPADARISGQAG